MLLYASLTSLPEDTCSRISYKFAPDSSRESDKFSKLPPFKLFKKESIVSTLAAYYYFVSALSYLAALILSSFFAFLEIFGIN